MASIDLSLAFSFGLLGSLHCVGMCGPIVMAYSMPLVGAGGWRSRILPHVAYNAGRITTYAGLGALAGAAGGALDLVGRIAGIENAAAIVAGILLIVTGLTLSGLIPAAVFGQSSPMNWIARVHRGISRLVTAPTTRSKFGLGLAMGFLPCGFLYAGLLKAVETGGHAGGAGTMLAFGAGTAGAMIACGLFSSAATAPLRRWSNVLAACGTILLGALLLYRAAAGHGMLSDPNPGDAQPPHVYHH